MIKYLQLFNRYPMKYLLLYAWAARKNGEYIQIKSNHTVFSNALRPTLRLFPVPCFTKMLYNTGLDGSIDYLHR